MSSELSADGLAPEDRELLLSQGWEILPSGYCVPPTSYSEMPPEKAVKVARHPSFKFILAIME